MKKIILTLLLAVFAIAGNAQEKGFHITASGSLGANYLRYKTENGNLSTPKLGFGGGLGVQYFFTTHWGLGTGVNISFYNTQVKYANSWDNEPTLYQFENMIDDDPRGLANQYDLRLKLSDWTETQQNYFLEVPLMIMYQTKFGWKEKWGIYAGLGAKLQLPIINQTFDVKEGSNLTVMGYYPAPDDLLLGDPNNPTLANVHGFGSNKKTDYTGDVDLKLGFAASAELGFLISISRRVDLTVGAYLDYGFTNIKDGNKTEEGYLLNPENGTKNIHPANYIGDQLTYNGLINSHAVDKVNPLGVGGKVGIRIKLGKLKELVQPEEQLKDTCYHVSSSKDTVVLLYTPKFDSNMFKFPAYPYPAQQGPGAAATVPATERVQPTDDELRVLFEPIFFDLDQSKLLPASIIILNKKVAILERYPKMQLLITGNTCDLGNSPHNIALGQRRATAAKVYMETLGIGKPRLSTVSQSFEHPMMPNINEENREKNRRCDFYPTGY